jgi:YesN/AraC family two-component response regulator
MYRLLIVDDEEDIRRGLADFFPWEEIGFRVVGAAEDGKQALSILRKGEVDVVFSDIRMPVMSGVELARILYETGMKVKVVFLSAYRDFSYARQALEYGVRGYVLKPTSYSEIQSVFKRLKKEMDLEPSALRTSETGRKTNTAIDAINGYMEREYARASLKEAARIVHMSSQYVSRLFKEKTGKNFNSRLKEIRMRKAAQLLQDVDYLTYEVSEIVGYGNPKNFSRTFKRYFGVSPRQFRHSSR